MKADSEFHGLNFRRGYYGEPDSGRFLSAPSRARRVGFYERAESQAADRYDQLHADRSVAVYFFLKAV